MGDGSREAAVAALLEEAADLHHRVYRITDGADEDWASWYAGWLLELSELPQVLGTTPARSHLVHALVQAERDRATAADDQPWPTAYAAALCQRFAAG